MVASFFPSPALRELTWSRTQKAPDSCLFHALISEVISIGFTHPSKMAIDSKIVLTDYIFMYLWHSICQGVVD